MIASSGYPNKRPDCRHLEIKIIFRKEKEILSIKEKQELFTIPKIEYIINILKEIIQWLQFHLQNKNWLLY